MVKGGLGVLVDNVYYRMIRNEIFFSMILKLGKPTFFKIED